METKTEKKLVDGKIKAALVEDKSIPFVNNFDGNHLLTIKKGTVLPLRPWTKMHVRKDDPEQLVVSDNPADVDGLEVWGFVIFDLGGAACHDQLGLSAAARGSGVRGPAEEPGSGRIKGNT